MLNKAVWFLMSPLTVGLLLVAFGVICGLRQRMRRALFLELTAFVWFWVWGTQALFRLLGGSLERAYPPLRAEDLPSADAIVVLGGGMAANTNLPYAEMSMSADRVWHAARLYRAGKAPMVIPSGGNEEWATVPLLLDLGVPREAILIEPEARNTEENAILVERMMHALPMAPTNRASRILLVTSAWHMRRSLLNFERTGLEVIPAATDHEALTSANTSGGGCGAWFPSIDMLFRNSAMYKEYLGYWLYRLKYWGGGRGKRASGP